MAGTQFGGSGGGDDRFGYYSAVVTKPAAGTGGPGTPAGAFGARYEPDQPQATRSSAVWVALLLVIVVLIGAVVGGWWWKQRGRIVVPDMLGGMQVNSTSQAGKAMDAALEQAAERAGSGNKVAGAVYGTGLTDQTVLVISRGPNVSAAQPAPTGKPGLQAYGPDLCQSAGKVVTCVRVRGELAVVVMAYRKGTPVPPAVVAGWTDEAWAAQ